MKVLRKQKRSETPHYLWGISKNGGGGRILTLVLQAGNNKQEKVKVRVALPRGMPVSSLAKFRDQLISDVSLCQNAVEMQGILDKAKQKLKIEAKNLRRTPFKGLPTPTPKEIKAGWNSYTRRDSYKFLLSEMLKLGITRRAASGILRDIWVDGMIYANEYPIKHIGQ